MLPVAVAGSMELLAALQESASCAGCIVMSSPNWMTGMIAGMILFMAMPFVVVLGIGGGLMRANRRKPEDDSS